MLSRGAPVWFKNKYGKTFLETSSIKDKLCDKIQEISNELALVFWKDLMFIKSLIFMEEDQLLEAFIKRWTRLGRDLPDPIQGLGNHIWNHKSRFPLSCKEFDKLCANYFNCDDNVIKESCKRNLDPEVALPFYESLTCYTLNPPTLGMYVEKLFRDIIFLSLILRIIDAVTDITLSIRYLYSWDDILANTPNNTMTGMYFHHKEFEWWTPGNK